MIHHLQSCESRECSACVKPIAMMKGHNCCLQILHTYRKALFLPSIRYCLSYLPCPSSSLLYSAISISSRVLMSSRIWYSWCWRSMSARSCINCSSRPVTCIWRPWSFIEYLASVSAKVPSRDAFWMKERGRQTEKNTQYTECFCGWHN